MDEHWVVRCICGNDLESCPCPSPTKTLTVRTPCSCPLPADVLAGLMEDVDGTEIVSVIVRDEEISVDAGGVPLDQAVGLLLRGAISLILEDFGILEDDEEYEELDGGDDDGSAV